MMKLAWCATLIFGACTVLADTTPYDFTGHWSGAALIAGQSAPVFADFHGTGTFTGALGIEVPQLRTCTVSGKQKKRVKIKLACVDGSKAKLRGSLDPASRSITGRFHGSKEGHHSRSGTFTLSSPGACVPTGQDCTDPATGGGQSAICCNGDCHRGVNPDKVQTHAGN